MTFNVFYVNSGKKKCQIAGRTLEDCERKVFHKLKEACLINRCFIKSSDSDKRDMALKSVDSITRFHKAAKTGAVKQEALKFIEEFGIRKDYDYGQQ